MEEKKIVEISSGNGDVLRITMSRDGSRYVADIFIDDVMYHIERLARNELLSTYVVDSDPDYSPESDADDCCYIVSPYSNNP